MLRESRQGLEATRKGATQLWPLPAHICPYEKKGPVYGVHSRSACWKEELEVIQSGGRLIFI